VGVAGGNPALTPPMSRKQRIIFLIIFAVPILNLLILGTIYHIPYAFPVGGVLALALAAVYIYLQKARRPTAAPRPRATRIAIRLYIGFALIALFNISAEGWHWYDLLYLEAVAQPWTSH
jgi:predicted PurR-regulated permease PerM